MAYFEFPHTRTYDSDLGWLIKHVKAIGDSLQQFYDVNVIKYAEPLQWSITNNYGAHTIVVNDDMAFISMKPVPAGIDLSDGEYWQLVGAFTSMGDNVKRYATAEDMKAAQGLFEGDLIQTAGYYNVDDGGAALYYITATEPASRWYETITAGFYGILVTSGAVNVRQLGAHGDGETDDTAIIQAAIDNYKEIYFPAGVYAVSDTITVSRYGITLFGTNDTARILQTATDKNGITVTNQHFTMFNMGVYSSDAANNTAIGIYKNTTFYMTLDNVTIDGFATGLFIDGTGSQGSDWLQNLHIYNYEDYGFHVNKCVDIYLVNFMFHAFTHPAEAGVYLTNKCESIILVNGDILRGQRGILTFSDENFLEDGRVYPEFSRFSNVYFDSYTNSCELDKTNMLLFDGCWFSYNTGSGNLLNLKRSFDIKFIGCNFNASLGQGVNVDNTCKSVSFNGCTFRQINRANASGVPALYLNATYCSVIDCLFTDPPAAIYSDYSIQLAAGATNSIISNNRFERYRTASILNQITTPANYNILNNVGAQNEGGTIVNCRRINNMTSTTIKLQNIPSGSQTNILIAWRTAIATIEITAAGIVTVRDIAGTMPVSGSLDTSTQELTLTASETMWGTTMILF